MADNNSDNDLLTSISCSSCSTTESKERKRYKKFLHKDYVAHQISLQTQKKYSRLCTKKKQRKYFPMILSMIVSIIH